MWVETFHRFADYAAFRAACAAWSVGPENEVVPGEGIVLDVIGPGILPPLVEDGEMTPGPIDPRWHVNVSRKAGTALPAAFLAAEIIPATPYRIFAQRDPDAALSAVRGRHEAARAAKANDPRLVADVTRPPRPPKPKG